MGRARGRLGGFCQTLNIANLDHEELGKIVLCARAALLLAGRIGYIEQV